MTALQVKALLAAMHVLPAVISNPVATSSRAVISSRHLAVTLAPHGVISAHPAATSLPVSQPLASQLALPSRVTAAKCLYRATPKSVLPATQIDRQFVAQLALRSAHRVSSTDLSGQTKKGRVHHVLFFMGSQ